MKLKEKVKREKKQPGSSPLQQDAELEDQGNRLKGDKIQETQVNKKESSVPPNDNLSSLTEPPESPLTSESDFKTVKPENDKSDIAESGEETINSKTKKIENKIADKDNISNYETSSTSSMSSSKEDEFGGNNNKLNKDNKFETTSATTTTTTATVTSKYENKSEENEVKDQVNPKIINGVKDETNEKSINNKNIVSPDTEAESETKENILLRSNSKEASKDKIDNKDNFNINDGSNDPNNEKNGSDTKIDTKENSLEESASIKEEIEVKIDFENNIDYEYKNAEIQLSPMSSSMSTSHSSNGRPLRQARLNSLYSTNNKSKNQSTIPKENLNNKSKSDNNNNKNKMDELSASEPSHSPAHSLTSEKVSKFEGTEDQVKSAQKEAVAIVKKLEADFTKLKSQIYQEKFAELTRDVKMIQDGTSPLLYNRTLEARTKRKNRIKAAIWARKYALWENASQLAAQQYSIDTQFLHDRFNLKRRIHTKLLNEKWKIQEAKIISEMQQNELDLFNKKPYIDKLETILNGTDSNEVKIEKIEDLKNQVESLDLKEIKDDIARMRGSTQRTGFSPIAGVGEEIDFENIILNIKSRNPNSVTNLMQPSAKANSYNYNPHSRETYSFLNPRNPGNYYHHTSLIQKPNPFSPPNNKINAISPQLEPPNTFRRTKVKAIGNEVLILDEFSYKLGDRLLVNDNLHAASFPAKLAGIGSNEIILQKFDGAKTKIQLTALSTGRYTLNAIINNEP